MKTIQESRSAALRDMRRVAWFCLLAQVIFWLTAFIVSHFDHSPAPVPGVGTAAIAIQVAAALVGVVHLIGAGLGAIATYGFIRIAGPARGTEVFASAAASLLNTAFLLQLVAMSRGVPWV